MRYPPRPIFLLSLSSFIFLPLLTACAPANTPRALLATLADTSISADDRLAADRRLLTLLPATDDSRLTLLEQLASSPVQPDAIRIYALDQLAAAAPARAYTALSYCLPHVDSFPLLQHACTLTTTLNDPRLIPPLIRSLARESKSIPRPSRPEVSAIEKLSGHPLADTLLAAVAGPRLPSTHLAALTLLPDFLPAPELRARLLAFPGGSWGPDPFLLTLQYSLTTFDYLPTTQTEFDALTFLRRPGTDPDIVAMHARLKSTPTYTFAPRFAATLRIAHNSTDTDLATADRPALVTKIAALLKPLRHIPRRPAYEHAPDDLDQSLDANLPKLSHADLLTILILLRALNSDVLPAEILRLGHEDLADTTTEYGGLLAVRNVADAPGPRPAAWFVTPRLYPPHTTGNDLAYMASDALLADSAQGLALFHLHFHQVHNAENAGPSLGDLDFARANRLNCVVFTSLDAHSFNADYYTPAGAVVDLGTYSDP